MLKSKLLISGKSSVKVVNFTFLTLRKVLNNLFSKIKYIRHQNKYRIVYSNYIWLSLIGNAVLSVSIPTAKW